MKKKVLFIYFIFCFSFAFCQQNTIEATAVKDSINTLIDLASNDINANNFQSALYFATQAVELSYKIEDKSVKSEAYACLANSYQIAEDYMNSEKYFKLALELGEETSNYYAIVAALNGLGNVESSYYNNINKAISYFEKASDYVQNTDTDNASGLFINSMNMASMYSEYNRNEKALEYLQLGEKHYKLLKNIPSVYTLTLYINYADYYKETNQFDKAISFYDKALVIAKKDRFFYRYY